MMIAIMALCGHEGARDVQEMALIVCPLLLLKAKRRVGSAQQALDHGAMG
jgi:hypothetical protein